jgi:hypothetical protein
MFFTWDSQVFYVDKDELELISDRDVIGLPSGRALAIEMVRETNPPSIGRFCETQRQATVSATLSSREEWDKDFYG